MRVLTGGKGVILPLHAMDDFSTLVSQLQLQRPQAFAQPLVNRLGDSIGMLCLVYGDGAGIKSEKQQGRLAFIEALSGFAAVTLESRKRPSMTASMRSGCVLATGENRKSPEGRNLDRDLQPEDKSCAILRNNELNISHI